MDNLEKRAYELAFQSEKTYGGCPQGVLRALRDCGLPISDDLIKASNGLAAGVARCGHCCGSLSGGIMAISAFTGRDEAHIGEAEVNNNCIRVSRKLTERFLKEYGSIECRDIQYKIMGRSYAMYDDADRQRFLDAGGHDDKCTSVVGHAAQWVIEILKEEGIIE